MKISLVHNANAGSAGTAAELRREIEDSGHEIVATMGPAADVLRSLDPATQLVVVAGGDGTVKSVATQLAGHHIPLAILPLGTANNIATSMGIEGTTEELIASWQTGRRFPVDLGVAHGPWPKRHFIESIGAGLVAHGIVVMDSEAPHDVATTDDLIAKALRRFHETLGKLEPRRCRLTLDGKSHEEDLLLLEVLNIRAVGPSLRLSPVAHPGDGYFDVVTAGEADRRDLERYLDARLESRPAELQLPIRRARAVELVGWDSVHVDDTIHTDLDGMPLFLSVDRAAVEIVKRA